MADEPRTPSVEQTHRITEEALRKLTDEELREIERLLEPLTTED